MLIGSHKYYHLLIALLLLSIDGLAQRTYVLLPVRIPTSTSLNVNFGTGISNVGPPLPAANTAFTFNNSGCPGPGEYSVVNNSTCAAWMQPQQCIPNFNGSGPTAGYWDLHLFNKDSNGYIMYVNTEGTTAPKIVFQETVQNLCGGNSYQFFATIFKITDPTSVLCGAYPYLRFVVTTVSGTILQDYQSNDIDYQSKFTLPAGETAVIVKIIINPYPSGPAYDYCKGPRFAIDNIQLLPFGPQPVINVAGRDPSSYIAGSCFQATIPILIQSRIDTDYLDVYYPPPPNATMNHVTPFSNPAYQWQKSDDGGFTWSDLPGETNSTLARLFNTPDTFLIRMRAGEASSISNPNCSVVSNIIKLEVDGLPKDYTFTSNSPVCTDSDMVFHLSGGASYEVTGPNGFYDNSAFPHIYHPSLSDTGWYYASIKSYGGCVAIDSTNVRITGPDLHVSSDTAICYGEAVHLQSSGGVTYIWTPSSGLSDAAVADPIASPTSTTTYKVKTMDQRGCTKTEKVTVKLLNGPMKADFGGAEYLCRDTDSTRFINQSMGGITNFSWDFGNGNISNLKDPPLQRYHINNNDLLFVVKLAVTDTSGCSDTATRYLHVVDNCYIAVPGAFTPNNDRLNDYLYPLNAYKAKNLSFRVYDRFGTVVFETRNRFEKWDGRIKGQEAATGTYVWILSYINADTGKREEQKGTTVLIR